MYDWITVETLVAFDSFTQNVLIVGGAIVGALVAPTLMGVASWL